MPTEIYNKNNNSKLGAIDLQSLYANVWVNADMAGAVGTSYNVSSIVDKGAGQLGVNFNIPFPSSDYAAMSSGQLANNDNQTIYQVTANLSSSRSDFEMRGGVDGNRWSIIITGLMS